MARRRFRDRRPLPATAAAGGGFGHRLAFRAGFGVAWRSDVSSRDRRCRRCSAWCPLPVSEPRVWPLAVSPPPLAVAGRRLHRLPRTSAALLPSLAIESLPIGGKLQIIVVIASRSSSISNRRRRGRPRLLRDPLRRRFRLRGAEPSAAPAACGLRVFFCRVASQVAILLCMSRVMRLGSLREFTSCYS